MTHFVHEFPGPSFRFRREVAVSEPAQVAGQIAGVFASLSPVMRPLALGLEVGVFEPSLGLVEYDQVVAEPQRAISTQLPAGLSVRFPGAPGAPVAHLAPEHVAAWVEQTLRGDARCVGVVQLSTLAAEAHVQDPAAATLQARPGTVTVPSRQDGADLWVAGPVPAAPGQPPIRVTIQHDMNILYLSIGVEWSWWSEGEGQRAMLAVVARLIDSGWVRID